MSMCPYNISNESKNNNSFVTTTLTCLKQTPIFFYKTLIFKSSKNVLHTLKLSLMSSEISYKTKQKLH